MHDPLTPPPLARNPDTVFLLVLLLTAGASQLATGAEPGSVAALVPQWVALGWALLLFAGSATTLAGVLWRNRVTGLLVEVVGRTMLAPACLVYTIAILAAAGASGLIPAAFVLALGAASVWRVGQIRAIIARLRHELQREAERRQTRDGDR